MYGRQAVRGIARLLFGFANGRFSLARILFHVASGMFELADRFFCFARGFSARSPRERHVIFFRKNEKKESFLEIIDSEVTIQI